MHFFYQTRFLSPHFHWANINNYLEKYPTGKHPFCWIRVRKSLSHYTRPIKTTTFISWLISLIASLQFSDNLRVKGGSKLDHHMFPLSHSIWANLNKDHRILSIPKRVILNLTGSLQRLTLAQIVSTSAHCLMILAQNWLIVSKISGNVSRLT